MTACQATSHGDQSAYRNDGCRCPDAITDKRRARKRSDLRRARAGRPLTHPAVGATRRVRALCRIGFGPELVRQRLGYDSRTLTRIITGRGDTVRLSTHWAIAGLYDEWCTEDGPSVVSRRRAERERWPGPEAWTDETIDDPSARPGVAVVDEVRVRLALHGNTTEPLTGPEFVAAVALGARWGWSDGRIAKALRRKTVTVWACRDRHSIPSGRAAA